MNTSLPYQTLHCHSALSDGDLEYNQILDTCLKNKIGIVAFTDHDVLPDSKKLKELKATGHTVKFIPGIEISCDTIPEVNEKLSTFHITGLFIDPTDNDLAEFTRTQLENRRETTKGYISGLKRLGFDIELSDIPEYEKGGSVGRPHIVKALNKKDKNLQVIDKLYKELEVAAKTDELRRQQLDQILIRQRDQKWFQLVLSSDSMFSVYPPDKPAKYVSIDTAVQLIRKAGGIAMVAHWSYLREKFTLGIVEKLLAAKRLDGMETTYAFSQEIMKDIFWQDMQDLTKLCEKYGKAQGGGGDFHRASDFEIMLDPKWAYLADKTPGMVGNILKLYPDLDLTWTSLKAEK